MSEKKIDEMTLGELRSMAANCTRGDRHIVVLDRGWIFAGDLSRDDKGVCTLTDCVNVRSWKRGGVGGLTRSARDSGAELDACAPIRFDESAVIFVSPIGGDWDA